MAIRTIPAASLVFRKKECFVLVREPGSRIYDGLCNQQTSTSSHVVEFPAIERALAW